MGGDPSTSVLLSTVTETPVIEEVTDQLGPDDELLVICDRPDDPVARQQGQLPAGASVVVAGEPDGCSGKANAIAAGLEAAENGRIVWTDDDFHHPPDWLARLHADYDEHGPVSEFPFFVGRDVLSVLLEPQYALSNTLALYAGDQPWGGAVMFEADDLDVAAFVADLRRTISDDGLLAEHLDVTTVRRARRVAVGGSIRETLERHVRFTQIIYRYAPTWQVPIYVALTLLATIAVLFFPVGGVVLTTLVAGTVYAHSGVRRPTFLLAYLATIVYSPLLVYGLARRTFVWGGRRYRWTGKFDVTVVDRT